MKPILYESTETLFQSNGLGVLSDCISCHVVEERNGQYEAEFEYPVDGIHYSDIVEGRIILISHDESGDLQPFDIYGHSKTINGVTTFNAHHIAYRQNGITVKPFTASSLSQTLTKIKQNSVNTNPFNYSTDKSVSASFKLANPKPLRSILGGEEGSLLDVYGTGEYEWDRFQVILHLHRGTDSGVVVRYGKNLISLQDDIDFSDSYNGIVPFWFGQNSPTDGTEAVDTLVTLTEWVLYKTGSTYDGRNTVIPVDFSSQFQTVPTESQLRTAAQSYLNKGNPLLPTDTLTFDFVELSQTEEYSYMALQQVNLCDTVKVIYDDIDTTMKVISVDWDVLNERYNSLTLGDAPATYAQVITDRLATIAETANEGAKLAKLWATNALSIAGNTDQYFWFTGTGTDTGAHITEVPKTTFLADPMHGGGNLIARSNGIAARNGLTELATFGANGSRVGLADGGHVSVYSSGAEIFRKLSTDNAPVSVGYFGTSNGSPWARLGAYAEDHINIDGISHGIEIFKKESAYPSPVSVAWFGAVSRIGASDSLYTRIAPAQIDFYDGSGLSPVSLVRFTPNAFRLGAEGGARILVQRGTYNGLEVFDENNTSVAWFGNTARIGASDSGRVTISSDSIQMYRKTSDDASPVSIAYFGMYNSKGWARIGALGENHINVDGTYNGIEIFRKLDTDASPVSVAWFGSSTRLGEVANGESRVLIQPSGIDIINRTSAGNDRTISHMGYGGTVHDTDLYDCAYFTFGTRGSGNIGGNSFAAGSGPVASGYNSFAFCVSATASGDYSFVLGHDANAGGDHSYAIGNGASATASQSFAIGPLAKASGEYQTVLGYANALDSSKLFILGNGYYDSSQPGTPVLVRSNALTVDWDGNLNISGAFKSLFKVVTTTVSVSAGSAGVVSTADYTLTEPSVSGYKPVAIVGISRSTYSVEPLEYWINSDTVLRAAFRRTATTTTASSIYFRVLWLKATS